MLGGLVQARIEWSPDGTLDSALRDYFPMIERLRKLKLVQSHVGPTTILSRALQRNEALPCNARLFDQFVQTSTRLMNAESRRDSYTAQLLLFHPITPNPGPMLALARFFSEHPGSRGLEMFSAKRRTARNSIGHQLLRASYLLRLQGNNVDAGWLESLLELHQSQVWAVRAKVFKRFDADPKLQHLLHPQTV